MNRQEDDQAITNYEERFDEAINNRLTSELWDKKIANQVEYQHRKQWRKRGIIFSLSSAASAAAVFFVLWGTIFVTNPASKHSDYSYARFVDQQVQGTYNMVFTASQQSSGAVSQQSFQGDEADSSSGNGAYGVILSSPTDEVISSALYVR